MCKYIFIVYIGVRQLLVHYVQNNQCMQKLDNICPVAISSFEDSQCPDEMSQPTTPSEMTTSDSTTTDTALLDTTDNTAAIVGGVVAVMIVLILAVTIIVIAILVTKNCKYKYPTDQDVG